MNKILLAICAIFWLGANKKMSEYLKAPFPYFGGKSTVADKVWGALGDVRHYIEPFFGSGAVLLLRPRYNSTKHLETVNDKDGFVANAWRSIQFQPDETAKWCDWPVNHADLMARRRALMKNESKLLENLIVDDMWCDPVLGGYWIWAVSCSIGRWHTLLNGIPHVTRVGQGVHAITKQKKICEWFSVLSDRLRRVRVICGDWTRLFGGNWRTSDGVCGIFFDPPYGVVDRGNKLYNCDSVDVAHDVRKWCIENGNKADHRIVLAGYEEHQELLDHNWHEIKWRAQGGYSNQSKCGNNNKNREVLYCSPHCMSEGEQLCMFS